MLVGQILWTTWASLGPVLILYVAVLLAFYGLRTRLGAFGFYIAFALVVTVSVQIVGIYLVFASLIIPALATAGLKRGNRLLSGYLIGAVSYGLGILISFLLDLPTGAVIVWTMAVVAVIIGSIISDKKQLDQP